jgi:hypothetical protein
MGFKPISPEELLSLEDYDKRREEVRASIIALKNLRRVECGPWVSLVFEDRRTVIYQIQEMLRIERITKPEAVEHEIETFTDLLPRPGELSATLFIEIPDPVQREAALTQLEGLESRIRLRVGACSAPAVDKRPIDPRFARPRASAVYYLGFPFDEPARAAFLNGKEDVWLEISHPRYKHAAAILPETRKSLSNDLL